MSTNHHSMNQLEQEITSDSITAIEDEQLNANSIYSSLEGEKASLYYKIPFPEVQEYDTGIDYDDISDIQYKKGKNKEIWKKIKVLDVYCNDGNLFCGHLNVGNTNFYFIEGEKKSRNLQNSESDLLINVDDRDYNNIKRWWRYPSENSSIVFSRNVSMSNKKVEHVDVILDKSDSHYASITDAYLRQALIRNKQKHGIQSIIQTIQAKQDNIRSLPANNSFIVQGCAGSGKTMVLLHRLRYLLYNRDIDRSDYVLLVPGEEFKRFIGDSIASFNISSGNIYSYQEYYQSFLEKKTGSQNTIENELLFDDQYLKTVYSKDIIREAYQQFFDGISKQIDIAIPYLEKKLNAAFEDENTKAQNRIEQITNELIETILQSINDIKDHVNTKIDGSIASVADLIQEIEFAYKEKKQEYDRLMGVCEDLRIPDNDERVLSNDQLISITNAINEEKIAISNASFFTAISHKNKLARLNRDYAKLYNDIAQKLVEADKQELIKNAEQYKYVYKGISLESIEKLLNKIKPAYQKATEKVDECTSNLSIEQFEKTHKQSIIALNNLIDYSGEIREASSQYINTLRPSYAYISKAAMYGLDCIKDFDKNQSAADKEYVKKNMNLFADRDTKQLSSYLNSLLFNNCKKLINAQFNTRICDAYKHYWYLALYCGYLTGALKTSARKSKYIFVDEAQDLSPAEIGLIAKINSIDSKLPIINLFGDTNQVISSFGISDWRGLSSKATVYSLTENFRNTKQIVDYCNKNLDADMREIGIDMGDVNEYPDLQNASKVSQSIHSSPIFIVKDDYAVSDLKLQLLNSTITDYEIYTVKSAKGLEFKEVFVFDTNMTRNEKYIAYTRALMTLNVIKSLPEITSRDNTSILQESNDADFDD